MGERPGDKRPSLGAFHEGVFVTFDVLIQGGRAHGSQSTCQEQHEQGGPFHMALGAEEVAPYRCEK